MSFGKKNQELLDDITDQLIAKVVSRVLRSEHKNDTSAVKRISANTGINIFTIPKWYQGLHAPKSNHLMILASVYPSILTELLRLISRTDLCSISDQVHHGETENFDVLNSLYQPSGYRDKFVHLNILIPVNLARQLNIRQLWFLGELQINKKIKAKDIADFWIVSERTGKRDIHQLCDFGIVKYNGANKTGLYTIRSL